jgi:flagellar basal body rod protein FlgG
MMRGLVLTAVLWAAAPPPGAPVARHASGTFEVKVTPLPKDEKVAGLTVGRYSVEKQIKGDLQGTSKGEMMAPDSAVEGSGGYVAVEQVTGTLAGRSGTFTLLHQGTMRKGAGFDLSIKVVPDSGTGQLAGLAGTMKIIIEGGKHSYEFDYSLPAVP